MPEMGPDVVELRYLYLECDLGDKSLNEMAWSDADEQCFPLEIKSRMKRNGLRIGKLGDRLPPALLKLIEANGDSPSGRLHQSKAGLMVKIQATEVRPKWNLFVLGSSQPVGEEIADAQGYLYITPNNGEQGQIDLEVNPVLEYGQHVHRRVPAPDLSGWQIRNDRDVREFPEFNTEVALSSGEFMLIGCWPEESGTLGHNFFTKNVSGKTRQTVLLICASRPSREDLLRAGYDFDDFFLTPVRQLIPDARSPARETTVAAHRKARF